MTRVTKGGIKGQLIDTPCINRNLIKRARRQRIKMNVNEMRIICGTIWAVVASATSVFAGDFSAGDGLRKARECNEEIPGVRVPLPGSIFPH